MEKFQSDNKSFSPERVEEEVGRFMMDAESVNMYIKYLKNRKMNPQQVAAEQLEAELSLSNPKTVCTVQAIEDRGYEKSNVTNLIIGKT
jgi:hypothetical protein